MTKETAQKIYNAINNNTVVIIYLIVMAIIAVVAIYSIFAGFNDIFYTYVVTAFYAYTLIAYSITEYTMMIIKKDEN